MPSSSSASPQTNSTEQKTDTVESTKSSAGAGADQKAPEPPASSIQGHSAEILNATGPLTAAPSPVVSTPVPASRPSSQLNTNMQKWRVGGETTIHLRPDQLEPWTEIRGRLEEGVQKLMHLIRQGG